MTDAPEENQGLPEFQTGKFKRRLNRLDVHALARLHQVFYSQLYRYALYSLGDLEASQAIASEVFLKMVVLLRQHSKVHNLPGWLFAATAEQVQARIRDPHPDRNLKSTSAHSELGRYGELFRRALHKLAPEQQHFLGLRFSQQASLEEIARWLGAQESEMRSQQYHALNALLEALGGNKVATSGEPIERALQVCIQHMVAGSQLDEIAASYPKWRQELHALLEAAHFSQYPGGIDPRQPFRLQAGMEGLQTAQEHSQAEFLQAAQVNIQPQPSTRLSRRLLITAGVVLVLVVAVAGMAVLSMNSLPGNALYRLKLGLESFSLELRRDAPTRLETELSQDQRRQAEVETMLRMGQEGEVSFSGVLEQAQGNRWQVAGIPVVISAESQILGEIQTGYSLNIQGKVTPERVLQADRLRMREVKIWGEIQSLGDERLEVDGLLVTVTPKTIWQGGAKVGDQVTVYLLLPSSGLPEARLVEVMQ